MRLLPSALAGRLRAWRVRRLVRGYRPRVVEHVYGAGKLKVYLSDPLSQGWYDNDWPELPELALLAKSRLVSGARVFDLGAHQGVVAALLARVVGPTGRVVAVEANPHNCEAARKNRELNDLTQVEVVQAAVCDKSGTLTFNEGLNGQIDDGTGAWGRFTVEAVTIDQLADRFGMPNVVFIDVEGAECLALAGAERVLAAGADFFVEVHVAAGLEKFHGSAEKVFSYFPDDRFERFVRAEADEQFRPLVAGDPIVANRFFLVAVRRTSEVSRS